MVPQPYPLRDVPLLDLYERVTHVVYDDAEAFCERSAPVALY